MLFIELPGVCSGREKCTLVYNQSQCSRQACLLARLLIGFNRGENVNKGKMLIRGNVTWPLAIPQAG